LLTESLLIALLGAAFGLLFATWAGQLFSVGEELSGSIDWRVLGFTTLLALLTAVGFGIVPAVRATRLNLTSEFQGGVRQLGRGARSRLSQTLLVVQMAISIVLLIGAGLFIRTLLNLRAADVGFNRSDLLLFALDATPAGYERGKAGELFERVRQRLESIPGIRSATFSDTPLLTGLTGNRVGRVQVPGRTFPREMDANISMNPVGPSFFATTEMPLILGRVLTAHDDASAQKVAVINQAMAKIYFGKENPIGRHFTVNSNAFEVVGVARDARFGGIRTAPWPTAFVPASQMSFPNWQTFTVRTFSDPAAMLSVVRKAVNDLNPNLLINGLRTQDDELNNNLLRQERSVARISSFFGLLALALSCVGLYGLMSYAVFQRTGEIGLRMALGALPGSMLWMILRESLSLVCIGVVIGSCAAVAATRVISEFLYGVSSTDPVTYGGVALLLLMVAAMACLLPARRAAKVDPIVALRCE
jgi:predicted permease